LPSLYAGLFLSHHTFNNLNENPELDRMLIISHFTGLYEYNRPAASGSILEILSASISNFWHTSVDIPGPQADSTTRRGKAMDAHRVLRAKLRRNSGSSLTEFAPGLMVLLICIFFPLVDLLSLFVSYGLCMVLNYNQVHEASLIPYTDATNVSGTVMQVIPQQWASGMGKFVKMTGNPVTVISYRNGETSLSDGVTDKLVSVTTTVVCNAWLPIPLLGLQVPGLNGPMTFSVTAERPMENPDYAQP
jgi:hypothetical protein